MPGLRRVAVVTVLAGVLLGAAELLLGVLVILAVGRTARQRLLGLAAAVPLGLIGALAFLAGGFRG